MIIDLRPVVPPVNHLELTPQEVQEAKALAKGIIKPLLSAEQDIAIHIEQAGLDAAAKLGNYTFNDIYARVGFNRFGGIAALSYQPVRWINFNLVCEFDGFSQSLDRCSFGDLPIPVWVLQGSAKLVISTVFDQQVAQAFEYALTHLEFSDEAITVSVHKSVDFKDRVKSSVQNIAAVSKITKGQPSVDLEAVRLYLAHIEALPERDELGYYVHHLLRQAQIRSLEQDPVAENATVLWALALAFGSERFAELISFPRNEVTHRLIALRGRQDHSLHFLYSIILAQVGSQNIGLKIGELKELFDTNNRGSGYSFADLSADMAGLAFAEKLLLSESDALKAQSILAVEENDYLFFPPSHDLPEGLREAAFAEFIGGMGSPTYHSIKTKIAQRIAQTPLYAQDRQAELVSAQHRPPTEPKPLNGDWYIVDTHIHTLYSDGNHSIAEIAQQAAKFGCDAIAITDHGDRNLPNLFNNAYFRELMLADSAHPEMSIIRGMEWNIPPFNGREHVTVLYPELRDYPLVMREFRDTFDNYGHWHEAQSDIANPLRWLSRRASQGGVSPVLIYNHPSRKDFTTMENAYDFAYWRQYSDLIIGFSGAPGHQKKRQDNNGSYETRLKTIHGWDPVVSRVGDAWDKLLMQGYSVWAARAASDFHNTQMDYWPCEFSTTHTFAASKANNDILIALKNGTTWAQHGRFVRELEFTVTSVNGRGIVMGERYHAKANERFTLELEIGLNDKDWQGNPTSLDDVGIVLIDEYGAKLERIFPDAYLRNGRFRYSMPLSFSGRRLVVRVFARSIQNELHHYMMYSNPIIIER